MRESPPDFRRGGAADNAAGIGGADLCGQGKERRRGRVAEKFGRLECTAAVALAAGVPAVIIRGGSRGKFRRCRLGRVARGWGWMATGVAGSDGRVARCGAGLRQRAAAL